MEACYKILILDDDEIDRMAVRRSLLASGIKTECFEAANYAEAIALFKASDFDIIFLDYLLPDRDGLTIVQELRREGIRIPVIVLTGQGDEQIAVELMKAGASDYLVKSRVTPSTLSRVVRNTMRIYQAEMQVVLANQQLRESHELLLRKNQELENQRQQIQLQNLQLLEVSRLKSQFLATMSHELRTPMNAIIGFSQLLLMPERANLTSQQQDMLKRILNNGKHLLTLVDDILDFSEIDAGKLELRWQTFDLVQLIQSIASEYRPLAQKKNLRLQVQVVLNNNLVVNDPMRLQQVIVNLLSNAIKFTDVGMVSLNLIETSPDRIAIAVQDTGIGISQEDLDVIFEAFRQIDQSTTRRHPGTGLGLAISSSLVQMMGGRISVESQLHQGSIFRIEIPRQPPSLEHKFDEKTTHRELKEEGKKIHPPINPWRSSPPPITERTAWSSIYVS